MTKWRDDLVYYFLSKADQEKLAKTHPHDLDLYRLYHERAGNLRECRDAELKLSLEKLTDRLKLAAKGRRIPTYISPVHEALANYLRQQ